MEEVKVKKRIGIVRGGTGEHFQSSLLKSKNVISYIFDNLSDKYKIVDVLIDKDGVWHADGIPINPTDLMRKVDLLWNLSNCSSVSSVLSNISIPNVDNGSFSKSLERSKEMLKKHMKSVGIKMPRYLLLPIYQEDFDGPIERYSIKKAKEVFEKFSSPWIVKSFSPDANMGIHLAKTFGELSGAIEDGVRHKKSILVEEFISGKVSSLHSVSSFRNQDIYVFPPKGFVSKEKEEIISSIKEIHKHLDIKNYLKSDIILHPKLGLYLTGVDFIPDLREGSHFRESCESVGAQMHHIIENICENTLKSNK